MVTICLRLRRSSALRQDEYRNLCVTMYKCVSASCACANNKQKQNMCVCVWGEKKTQIKKLRFLSDIPALLSLNLRKHNLKEVDFLGDYMES